MTIIKIKSIFGKVLFTYANENATIKDAVEQAVKEKVSLKFANLHSANLHSANLYLADLRSANLHSANLHSADLSLANLRSADLRLANLHSANLHSANLYLADLRSANLHSANLHSADLSSADLSLADLSLAENKETAYLPIFCKWYHSVIGNKIKIGCKEKTIEDWDIFFASDEIYSTERNTYDFKQIQATYEAYKAYLTFLNK